MKSLLQKWAERDKFTLFFCSGAFLAIAIALIIMRLYQPKIESKKDLQFLNGQLSEHHYTKTNNGLFQDCWFMLKGYNNMFYIDRVDLGSIDITAFTNLADGDSISIAIAKRDTVRLNYGNSEIYIHSFRCGPVVLDYHKAIKNYNGIILYSVSAGLFLISILFFYLGCISKNNIKPCD